MIHYPDDATWDRLVSFFTEHVVPHLRTRLLRGVGSTRGCRRAAAADAIGTDDASGGRLRASGGGQARSLRRRPQAGEEGCARAHDGFPNQQSAQHSWTLPPAAHALASPAGVHAPRTLTSRRRVVHLVHLEGLEDVGDVGRVGIFLSIFPRRLRGDPTRARADVFVTSIVGTHLTTHGHSPALLRGARASPYAKRTRTKQPTASFRRWR